MMSDEPEPEPEPEKTVLACPTYSCGDLADFQCSRGRSVVKFELEKTEYALFPSLIHQVNSLILKKLFLVTWHECRMGSVCTCMEAENP